MSFPSTTIVLAADGSIVFVIVLIISIISWVVNLVQGNNQKGKPQNRNRTNQGKSDLEKFLQDVVGGGKQDPDQESRKKPASQKQNPSGNGNKKPAKPKPQQQPAAANKPTGARPAKSPLTPSAMGDGGRSHVGSNLDSRSVDAAVKQDVDGAVQRDINDTVRRDMGADSTNINVQRTVHPLILALRNPQGVRQAIMLAEILNRPKSLR